MSDRRGFSVKDSFQCLELVGLGFTELFRATWIHRDAALPESEDSEGEPSWVVVRSAEQLEIWERAWRGVPDNAEAPERTTVLRWSLLERPDMALLWGGEAEGL